MSLKVINIQNIGDYLTVDNNIITVDNDVITVDQTINNPETYTLKVPYRFFTNQVKMRLWNEIKETEDILNLSAIEDNGQIILEFHHNFLDGETYEVRITDLSDALIWRGKILATTQTDLENYILHKNDNGIIKI